MHNCVTGGAFETRDRGGWQCRSSWTTKEVPTPMVMPCCCLGVCVSRVFIYEYRTNFTGLGVGTVGKPGCIHIYKCFHQDDQNSTLVKRDVRKKRLKKRTGTTNSGFRTHQRTQVVRYITRRVFMIDAVPIGSNNLTVFGNT